MGRSPGPCCALWTSSCSRCAAYTALLAQSGQPGRCEMLQAYRKRGYGMRDVWYGCSAPGSWLAIVMLLLCALKQPAMAHVQVFSKCGLIRDGDDGRPRIKIYRDRATGMPKGDGLVTYLKEPSVRTAGWSPVGSWPLLTHHQFCTHFLSALFC